MTSIWPIHPYNDQAYTDDKIEAETVLMYALRY